MKKSKKKKNRNKPEIGLNEKDVLTLDDLEMLDEVEDNLEELCDDIYQKDSDPDGLLHPIDLNNKEIKTETLKTAVDLLATPTVCSMLLDKNFFILYISDAVKHLFDGYHNIEQKPFFNIFGSTLEKFTLDDLLAKLRSPKRGYSWSGVLKHKTRYRKTMYTKTNIFPLFDNNELNGYWVMFEDISNSYLSQYKGMMESLLNASKLKDNDTGFHNERLNYYSKALAEALFKENLFPQIDADFIDNISSLASIHDIGKIGTPDYILQKKGSLNDVEWSIMREHTINGTLILANYPIPMAKEITLSHHERWDGQGYPYKLAGEMIPLSARIVAIADVYDALRMKRSYKEEMPHDATVEHIINGAGAYFDPTIIEVFKTIDKEFCYIWDQNNDQNQAK
ncbi:HD-GYP domain-containing protein [Treponema putidum]|uniref:HD-GYP domain-containing protein n=1 Tax=Treponema putidum TaxID=221027 RepID=UPI0004F863B0|nr:HD-GYP domain-containing protein [Treponema putidum]AIN94710.1 phosphohydrolase [Treponema putidum]TWI77578.1 putative two-component system response regulator [Treponema putidum]